MWGESTVSKRMVGLGLVVLVAALAVATALLAGDKPMADKAKPVEKVVADTYPLETCVVTGAKLGSMGDPVIYDYQGREIRFCCKGCVKQFEDNPKVYLKKLDEAVVARDLSGYPLETCVVTGKSLTGKDVTPVDYVYDNRLVRLIDDSAVKTFMKDPEKYLKKLDDAQMMHDMKMMEMNKSTQMVPAKEAATESMGHSSCGGH